MINIVVCDDNMDDIKKIKKIIDMYSIKEAIDLKTRYFISLTEFEEYFFNTNSMGFILLFDVQIGDNNGINEIEMLRKKFGSKIQSVIFISNYPKFVFDSFKAHPDGYICKPIEYDNLQSKLSNIIQVIDDSKQKKKVVMVHNIKNDSNEIIPEDQIIAVKVIDSYERSVSIITTNKIIMVHDRLNNLMEMLNKKYFFQPYRSVVVNLRWIRKIKKTSIEMNSNNDLILPLSRLKRKSLIEKLDNHILREMGENG